MFKTLLVSNISRHNALVSVGLLGHRGNHSVIKTSDKILCAGGPNVYGHLGQVRSRVSGGLSAADVQTHGDLSRCMQAER